MKKKIGCGVVIVFLIIGILFFVGGLCAHLIVSKYEGKIETTGVITRIDEHHEYDSMDDEYEVSYDVYVTYDVDGYEHTSLLNGYMSSYKKGMTIDIYYDKDSPDSIGSKELDNGYFIIMIIGGVITAVCVIILVVLAKIKNGKKRLKETGTLIYANYIAVRINESISVNDENPYNIYCEWTNPSDSQRYIFRSENLWENPEYMISQRNITVFPIYVDMNNLKKYVYDLERAFNMQNM